MKNLKKNYLTYLFIFLLLSFFNIDSVLCESIDSFDENNIHEKDQKIYNKIVIITGIVFLITIGLLYFTSGDGFDDTIINDVINNDTIIKTVTDVVKEIPHKRTEAERIAFLRTYHIGLRIPSYL